MKKGVLSAIVVILLAAIIVLVCGIGSSWFTNGDFSTWFNSWGKGEEQEEPADEDDGTPAGEETVAVAEDGTELGSGDTLPMQGLIFKSAKTLAAGADAQNEEYASVTLTATVTPSWATQELSWSVAFNNPTSEWATGKTVTDYVTVTPGETTLTATMQCLQPFGEQIVVTVSADEFEGVAASCTVDFAQRIKKVIYKDSQNLGSDGNGIDFSTAEYIVWDHGFREQNTFTLTTIFYDYTIVCDLRPDGSGGYVMGSNPNQGRYPGKDGVSCILPKYGVGFNWNGENTFSLFEMTSENSPGDTMSDEGAKALETWLSIYADENDIYAFNGSLKTSITEGYNYTVYSTYPFLVPLRLNASKFEASVSLSLDETAVTA